MSPKGLHAVFERFRSILHEAQIDKRYGPAPAHVHKEGARRSSPAAVVPPPPPDTVQYMIEVLFQVRKDKFKDHPAIPEALDLVEEEEQITHYLTLDEVCVWGGGGEGACTPRAAQSSPIPFARPWQELDTEEMLDVFSVDPNYLENETKYKEVKAEILVRGERRRPAVWARVDRRSAGAVRLGRGWRRQRRRRWAGERGRCGRRGARGCLGCTSACTDAVVGTQDGGGGGSGSAVQAMEIRDMTNTNILNLRRTIFLTIMSSVNFEECVHKVRVRSRARMARPCQGKG
jgi:pre-mRNA-splicing factor CWC22